MIDQKSGRLLLLDDSQSGPAGYRAYNLRERLKSGGPHTLTIKLYYGGSCYDGGVRRKESIRVAQTGDYMVMGFLRMEK